METRKLQEVGGGTFTVSIPKEWAKVRALEAGSTVELFPYGDDSIVVQRSGGDEIGEARIDCADERGDAVARALRTTYMAGFDAVTLVPEDSFATDTRRAIRETVRDLVGGEIVEETDEAVTVRSLLDVSAVPLDGSLVRLQSSALSIQREATGIVLDGDDRDLERLQDRHREVSRVVEMITRHFGRSLLSLAELDRLEVTQAELFEQYVAARQLERVAQAGLAIARRGELTGAPEIASALDGPAGMARRVVDDATTALLQQADGDRAIAALDRHAEATAELEAVERTLFETDVADARTAVATARTIDNLTQTAEHGARIANAAIRTAARERDE